MPDSSPHLDAILDAAYLCFTRHGIRRTTMDDLAQAAGMSRPALYQHVRNKDDAYRRLAVRLYTDALELARAAVAAADRPLADRLTGALSAKLALTLRLGQDSPHAAELIGHSATVAASESRQFMDALADLLEDTVRTARPGTGGDEPAELAQLLLSLVRGLESHTNPDTAIRRLRRGVDLLVLGLDHETPGHLTAPPPAGPTTGTTRSQESP